MRWFYRFWSNVTGKNLMATPVPIIADQLLEPRPLPMGVQEFHEWSDRIISGALVPAERQSQKFALAEMIMHLKPTQDFCDDSYFIHCLRKGAVNQVAFAMMEEIRNARKAALAAKESAPEVS